MDTICESSLYTRCSCKTNYHLPIGLPIYDGHCHVDLFYNYRLKEYDFNKQLSNGRKLTLIDNRHKYYQWLQNYELKSPNITVYTTFGIHPKSIPNNLQDVYE